MWLDVPPSQVCLWACKERYNYAWTVHCWIVHRWIVNRWIVYCELAQPFFTLISFRSLADGHSFGYVFFSWKLLCWKIFQKRFPATAHFGRGRWIISFKSFNKFFQNPVQKDNKNFLILEVAFNLSIPQGRQNTHCIFKTKRGWHFLDKILREEFLLLHYFERMLL